MAATIVIIKSKIPNPIRKGIPMRIILNNAETMK